MNDLTTLDRCVARQRELEKQLGSTKDKAERESFKLELAAVLERMRVLKAAKLSRELPKAPGPKKSSPVDTSSEAAKPEPEVEVIRLRRPSRPPSRPPEAVLQSREPRPFADLRAGIAAETRRR